MKSFRIVEEDVNSDQKKDLTIMGPHGPITTIYGWKQMVGYFCGVTLSLVCAGLSVGAILF